MKPAVASIVTAVLVASMSAGAAAGSLPPGYDDNPTVVDAVAKARTTGKPVIVYLTEQNCQICGALDGWLVRSDLRQAFGGGYHFAMVFSDDMTPEERARWRATYVPRGAPAWVVLSKDGQYVCTASGGFATAAAALDLHKVLAKAVSRPAGEAASRGGDAGKMIEVARPADAPTKPRSCSAQSLGV
jgi:hypothetical protein